MVLAQTDPGGLTEACSDEPANICKWVYEQTGNVGLAKAATWLGDIPLQILTILLVALVLRWLARRSIRKLAANLFGLEEPPGLRTLRKNAPAAFIGGGEVNVRAAARAETVASVLSGVASVTIGIFAFFFILDTIGMNLGPLIAGAGLAGAALGFGAQSLVKDYLSGIFMIIEDQFGVGDSVDVGEASGTVEQITLRVTRLRDVEGTVWHVPNGEILRVGNKSQEWARALLDVAVSPSADLERASQVIEEAAQRVWASEDAAPDVLDQPAVLGMEYLGPDAAVIRVNGRVQPGAQWRVARLMRVEISRALEQASIELPSSVYLRPPV